MNGYSGGKHAKNSSGKKEKFLVNGKACVATSGDSLASALLQNEIKFFRFSSAGAQPSGVGVDRLSAALCKINRGGAEAPECYVNPEEVCVDPEMEVFPEKNASAFHKITAFFSFTKPEKKAVDEAEIPVKTRDDLLTDQVTDNKICPSRGGTITKNHLHCDVIVIGSDGAGLICAAILASSGRKVAVCRTRNSQNPLYDFSDAGRDIQSAYEYLRRSQNCVFTDDAEIFTPAAPRLAGERSEYIALHAPFAVSPGNKNFDAPLSAEVIYARDVIYAVGLREIPILFPGVHLPNVMTAEKAARLLLPDAASPPVKKPLFLVNNDRAYALIDRFLNAGVKQITVYDIRPRATAACQAAIEKGVKIFSDTGVQAVTVKKDGGLLVTPVRIAETLEAKEKPAECDVIIVSGGFRPDFSDFALNDPYLSYPKGATFPVFHDHAEQEKRRRYLTGAGTGVTGADTRRVQAIELVRKMIGDFEKYPGAFIPEAPIDMTVFPPPATEFPKCGGYDEKGFLRVGVSVLDALKLSDPEKTTATPEVLKNKVLFHHDPENARLLCADQEAFFRYADALRRHKGEDISRLSVEIREKAGADPLSRERLRDALFADENFTFRKTPLNDYYTRERLSLRRLSDGCLAPITFMKEEDRFIHATVTEEMSKKIIESCGVQEQSGRPLFLIHGKDASAVFTELLAPELPTGRADIVALTDPIADLHYDVALCRAAPEEYIVIGEREDGAALQAIFTRYEEKFPHFAVTEAGEQSALFRLVGVRSRDVTRILPEMNQAPVLHENGFLSYWFQNVPIRMCAATLCKYHSALLWVPSRYAEAVFLRLIETKIFHVIPFGEDVARNLCEKKSLPADGKLFSQAKRPAIAVPPPVVSAGFDSPHDHLDTDQTAAIKTDLTAPKDTPAEQEALPEKTANTESKKTKQKREPAQAETDSSQNAPEPANA